MVDPVISDHKAVIVSLSRTNSVAQTKLIKKVNVDWNIMKIARDTKLTSDKFNDLNDAVEELSKWCKQIKDKATTIKKVRSGGCSVCARAHGALPPLRRH